ncbi:hypothetical protein GTS_20770 [Gandjariella thermophila]|uniref:Uncharacterized protein n=1 Tax=Gandjariella thermophila TaxID=1931992 RepID=A0A4D4J4Q8_9PSEU|nr:hypothetical protein GTS_20770 [Gandjariella thermophila]
MRWLVPVVLLVVLASAGAGLLARQVYQRPAAEPVPMVGPTSVSSMPATEQPGDPVVRLTADAAAHPDRDPVRELFQRFFDATNQHNYNQWRSTISPFGLNWIDSESSWLAKNESTRDGSIVVQRIDPAPGGNLRVLVSFMSTQDPKKAPENLRESCIRWHLVYSLVRASGGFKIDFAREQSTTQMEKC